MLTLEGRTCVIAGGTGNIASEAVFAMLEKGMNVALLSHFPQKCQKMVEKARSYPGECQAFGNEKDMDGTLKTIEETFGSIDVYISKTGILEEAKPLAELNMDDLDKLMKRQVSDILRNIQKLLPYLKKSKAARIVLFTTVGSMNGFKKENLLDSIAKGAVNSMIYALANELAEDRITVNGVNISGFIQDHDGDGLNSESMLEDIPLHRLGNGGDLSAVLEYLVSEEAGFITGEILNVNGGLGIGL